MTLMSNCCLPSICLRQSQAPRVELVWRWVHVVGVVMPSQHGILAESPPTGPPLPQDLPRTQTQLVSHLLGYKQNRTKYVAECCQEARHLTSFRQRPTLLQLCVYQASLRSLSQNLQGLSPLVWMAISIPLSSTHTPVTPGSPSVWHQHRSILFS